MSQLPHEHTQGVSQTMSVNLERAIRAAQRAHEQDQCVDVRKLKRADADNDFSPQRCPEAVVYVARLAEGDSKKVESNQ